ncbi:MAG: tRNA (adenosine(37)-N6)-threonylcarbamoyltransferase complex dimerization subunit type 1 TsaB, partial [Streptomycetaceae bacterium]
MTISLAIDTSTSRTCVAVIENGKILWSGHKDGATAHGPALPALVAEAIQGHAIDEVVVGMGPGPFTGLRIGIVFARSFALSRNIEVRGVCSLDAIAAQVNTNDFIITVDA